MSSVQQQIDEGKYSDYQDYLEQLLDYLHDMIPNLEDVVAQFNEEE